MMYVFYHGRNIKSSYLKDTTLVLFYQLTGVNSTKCYCQICTHFLQLRRGEFTLEYLWKHDTSTEQFPVYIVVFLLEDIKHYPFYPRICI